MTSTLAQGVGHSPGEPVRPLSLLALSPALLVLLFGGLALRLTIAYVLFPSSGFESDLASYGSWATTMAEHGPSGFYGNAGFADYPPAYLYLLWVVGLLAGPGGDAAGLVKLPPILLDVAVGYVIFRLVRGWTWPGYRSETLALGAAALYLFNPVSFYDSALWGQSDVAGALVVLLAVAALIRGNSEGAAALAATAALVKPQFGVVLIPLVAFVLIKRHLVRPGSGPRQRPWAPPALGAWLSAEQGPLRLLTAFGAAWLAFFIIALPFGMGPMEYLERMLGTAAEYDYLTVNAYNAWALVGLDGAPSLAEALNWLPDTEPLAGPVQGVVIGGALLLVGFLWGTLRAAARDDRWTIIVAATFLALAFFILPTRVHERYIFPVIALMPLLAVVQRRWALALLLLSVGAFINLHGILTLPLYGSANVETLPLGAAFRTQPWIAASALLQTAVGLWVAWQLRPSLRTSPDGFEREAALFVSGPPASSPGAGPGSASAASAPTPLAFVAGPGTTDWIVSRLSWGSLRRDRSAALACEPGGRIDRRDLLVLVVLIALTLTTRGFRLDQPVRMYFDEVYHARTATEFLQHWEYGEPHDIYEFTHPHLAKYAMAWGIRAAGGNKVTSRADLGVVVEGTELERRWSPSDDAHLRNGDRLYIGTGEALQVYDLASRELITERPLSATALSLDQDDHTLFLADALGALYRFDTTSLDAQRHGRERQEGPVIEALSGGPEGTVEQLLVTDTSLVAVTAGSLSTFDTETGVPLSERFAVAVSDVVELPWTERLLVDTSEVPDREAAAAAMAEVLGDEFALDELQDRLEADGHVVITAYLDDDTSAALAEAIEAGRLPGTSVERGPLLAASDGAGISILDAWTLDLIEEIDTDEPVEALVLVRPDSDEPVLYAAAGPNLLAVDVAEDGLSYPGTVWMPGPTQDLAWNDAAGLLHVLGRAPEGSPTVYVVEPNGNSVFADAPLSEEPAFLLSDTQPDHPAADRTELLAIAAEGSLARIEIGQNALGWRLPGVLLGVLAAALLYLLARVLFARRSVALITAVLIVAEGMFFANSRIAMNDVYVTTFIVLAALLFAPLYLAPRRLWTAVLLLLGVGLALGLALASKWVALYAIGGLGLLVLLRSALGRIIALTVMITLTSVLGAAAIRAPPGTEEPTHNWIFLVLMLGLTGLLVAGMIRRPLPFTRTEAVLAVVMPAAAGLGLALTGRPLAGGLALAAAAIVVIAAALATRRGRGPFAPGATAPPEGTSAWLRPGPYVVPWLLTLGALTVLPLLVYVVGYAPWVDLGNAWGWSIFDKVPFLPGSVDGGRTVADLTESMYRYHDDLRATHAASSPWWAWPLDLKPVWFFSQRYAGPTQGLIYDSGNLVIFWMGIAGMAFGAWAAWRRRSLSLTLVVIMWAALWLPWARIDRATFQYHVYASLPFLVLALAYFLAELWHGPSVRTWFLARAAAALAIIGAPLSWLLRTPLCILSGTAVAHPDGVACASQVTRTAQLSEGGVTALFLLGVGAAFIGYLAWRASRTSARYPGERRGQGPWLVAMVIVGLATLGAIIAALLFLDTSVTVQQALSSDLLALMGLALMAIPAWLVLRARDPRRFVLGVLGAALIWLVLWYPNLSGLPLPADFASIYQGLLPTWNYDFQFGVNTDLASDSGLIDGGTLVVVVITVVFVTAVALAAWLWARPRPGDPPSAQED